MLQKFKKPLKWWHAQMVITTSSRKKNMTYFTPERRSIVCLQPMQFKIEIMSLSNFRSFLRGKFRSARGYLCLLHMIHINGFGVKKQPPIGSLSNICLVLVKTVPLLAASMWHYGISELLALQVVFPTKNYGHWIWWCPCDICDSQFWKKKVFKKPISSVRECGGKNSLLWPVFH